MARRPEDTQAQAGPQSDGFWPRFWFNVCRYSEYYYMLLILLTVFAIMNGLTMLIGYGQQPTGAFVVSIMVFALIGITAGSVGVVLYKCNQMRTPSAPGEASDDADS